MEGGPVPVKGAVAQAPWSAVSPLMSVVDCHLKPAVQMLLPLLRTDGDAYRIEGAVKVE